MRRTQPYEMTSYSSSFVNYKGTSYYVNDMVIYACENTTPLFGQIINFTSNDLILRKYNTSHFDLHKNAYKVDPSNEPITVAISSLNCFEPLDIYYLATQGYVILRHLPFYE